MRIDEQTYQMLQVALGVAQVPEPVLVLAAATKQRQSALRGAAPLSADVCALICAIASPQVATAVELPDEIQAELEDVKNDPSASASSTESPTVELPHIDWKQHPKGTRVIVSGDSGSASGTLIEACSGGRSGQLKVKMAGDSRPHRYFPVANVALDNSVQKKLEDEIEL